MPTGGSIESVSLNGRNFAVAADAESQRKIGGFENEVSPNGDGTARLIKTVMSWSLDGIALVIDDVRSDQEFLQGLADANDFFAISITYASGVSYSGTGQISGDFTASSQNVTGEVTLAGPGVLTKQ